MTAELDPNKSGWQRCPMSGKKQMLSWFPDGKGYPGAVVCIDCSYGVLVAEGSTYDAVSEAGVQGVAGKVMAHQVKYATDSLSGQREIVAMRYTTKRKEPAGGQ